jgi:glycosyltransferase involved in cell wall biosynthesis
MQVGIALLTLFPGRVGGSETYVRGLLGEYAEGHGPERVAVLANRHVMATYGDFARGPVSLHHVASYRPGDANTTRLLAMARAAALPRAAARDVPPGLDALHYPVTVPIPATSSARIVALHDIQHHDLPGLFSRAERAYRRWAYDRSARTADLVITGSEHARARIVEGLGIPPERIEVVYHGIDHRRFAPGGRADEEQLLERYALPSRFVVYPANLWAHKNHRRLVEALAAVPDRDLHLVLTGQDYGRVDELRRRADELSVGTRVHHLGHVSMEILASLYRRAQAMVFPSLYEGFGAPPLEAMACGCPVASSDATSLPEVCGDAALLFEARSVESIAEAIARVSADVELRQRLIGRGLARARSFTWRASAERHRAIYARVAATRRL